MTELTSQSIATRSLLSEGVFLAVASAYVYCATFVYEYGFCNYFGIPASLISPNTSTFLVAAFALGVTLLPALNFLAFTVPLFKAARDPKRRAYRDVYVYTAIVAVVGILMAAIYGISLIGVALYIVASLIFLIFLFLPAILTDRHLPVSERFSKHADIQDEDPFVATNLFEGWVSLRIIRIGFAALVFLFIAYLVGDAEARKKDQFLALSTEQDVVLLRSYGGVMVFARLGNPEAQINGFRFMWLGEKSELNLISRQIGPITRAQRQDMKPNDVVSSSDAVSAPAFEALSPSK